MATTGGTRVYAVVHIGELSIGVDASYVSSALRRPVQVTPLPPIGDTLLGTFAHDGGVVPLLDLRGWIGAPRQAPCDYVLIVRQDGRAAGLAVDRIGGLLPIADNDISLVRREDTPSGFFTRVARRQDNAELLNLLEPASLMERAQAWTGAGHRPAAAQAAATLLDTDPLPMALFAHGAQELALPAMLVGEVLPCPPINPIFGTGAPFAGVVQWRGHHLCVLRRGMIDASPSPGSPLLVVLASDGRYLGIEVDAALSVSPVARDALQLPLQKAAAAAMDFGTWTRPGMAPVRLIDPLALMAWSPELSAPPPAASQRASTRNPDAYLICAAGAQLALPMSSVVSILALPDDVHRPSGAPGSGSCTWQGSNLPLIEPGAPGMEINRVVVVEHGGRRFGLLMHEVVTIIAAHTSVTRHLGQRGAGCQALLMVEQGDSQATYRLLDLSALLPLLPPAGNGHYAYGGALAGSDGAAAYAAPTAPAGDRLS